MIIVYIKEVLLVYVSQDPEIDYGDGSDISSDGVGLLLRFEAAGGARAGAGAGANIQFPLLLSTPAWKSVIVSPSGPQRKVSLPGPL